MGRSSASKTAPFECVHIGLFTKFFFAASYLDYLLLTLQLLRQTPVPPLSHAFKWLAKANVTPKTKSELAQLKVSDAMITFCENIKFQLLDASGFKEATIKRLICTNSRNTLCGNTLHESLLMDSDRLSESAPGDSTHICAGKPEESMVVRSGSWVTVIAACLRPAWFCHRNSVVWRKSIMHTRSPQWERAAIISFLQVWHC